MQPDTDTWAVPHGRMRPIVKVQAESFWLNKSRDSFTKVATAHFEAIAPPAYGTITLQAAARMGTL